MTLWFPVAHGGKLQAPPTVYSFALEVPMRDSGLKRENPHVDCQILACRRVAPVYMVCSGLLKREVGITTRRTPLGKDGGG